MLDRIARDEQPLRAPHPVFKLPQGDERERSPGLPEETTWRGFDETSGDRVVGATIVASPWTDRRTSARREEANSPDDRYVIGIALHSTRLRLMRRNEIVFDGNMPTGMLHVTSPSELLSVEFYAPCDFLHIYASADWVQACRAADGSRHSTAEQELSDFMTCDPVAVQLGRTLTEGRNAGEWRFAESGGQIVVLRLLALRLAPPRSGALAKWRLRRVQEHISRSLEAGITLADLAAAAGLSRMHFAARFRAATGCRPHEYLLQQRIECAKAALLDGELPLAEIALSVGFQTQSHFQTVFRRITGETPAGWRRGTGNDRWAGRPPTWRTCATLAKSHEAGVHHADPNPRTAPGNQPRDVRSRGAPVP